MVPTSNSSSNHTIQVINFGGLANRLNNIINGMFLSSSLNRKLKIFWPINNACSCKYSSIFTNDIEVIEFEQEDGFGAPEGYYKLAGENTTFFRNEWGANFTGNNFINKFQSYNNIGTGREIFKTLRLQDTDILLQGNSIFYFISIKNINKYFNLLSPTESIAERVLSFTNENNIDRNVIGIHIRRTDSPSLDDSLIIHKINSFIKNNRRQKIFLCSDSSATEKKISMLYPDNIIIHEKNAHAEKRSREKSWVSNGTGSEKYNVFRSQDSVILALIDFYILSKTSIKVRSSSTFSQLAYYLSISDSIRSHHVDLRRKISSFIK